MYIYCKYFYVYKYLSFYNELSFVKITVLAKMLHDAVILRLCLTNQSKSTSLPVLALMQRNDVFRIAFIFLNPDKHNR
jgi:hypothetical protein